MSSYSPGIPTSFDPALLSEFEILHDAPASLSYSDEIDAIQQCVTEEKAKKNRAGVVIQHRAWKITDIFRSEGEAPIDTPLKQRTQWPVKHFRAGSSTESHIFPSSPPVYAMPLISSPVAYPPSSSMPQASSPKKRKRSIDVREPLKDVQHTNAMRKIGGFLDDSDDEDDIAALKEHTLKRRAVSSIKDLPSALDGFADYTPPASQDDIADPETVPVGELDKYSFESQSQSPIERPPSAQEPTSAQPMRGTVARNSSGKAIYIPKKAKREAVSYEQLIAARSVATEGKARTSYYGLNIHELMDEAKALDLEKAVNRAHIVEDLPQASIEQPISKNGKSNRTLMWTEKYRAKKFTDLVGDERTHRSVLRWLKAWDPIVFPGSSKAKPRAAKKGFEEEEQRHRKILLLTGPPGLGKTTLAHVCARQAGYEVQEINASDERSRDVVKGRIRDMVGTENVRGISTNTSNGKARKAGKPVCVVVDEVDGVVGGSGGGGEGGFVKALIDLINLDEKNSKAIGQQQTTTGTKKRKGDKFRLLRPLVLICNDLYHPSLRPLRQSSMAEIIHIRKPALNMVVTRMQDIFVKEGIQCDSDGVRRLCEATWGVSTKKEGGTGSGTGEGDIRGIMVVSEWVAGRLRSSNNLKPKDKPHLTRKWIEDNFINDLRHGGGAARSLGRGGAKDVVDRVFREGAGFPKQAETTDPRTAASRAKNGVIGVAEGAKRRAMERLREMVDTSGDCDRIVTDCFTAYPDKPFQDDTLLSKPTSAYEWLHFHDTLNSAVHGSQEWELAPYLSNSVLAFHNLFASPARSTSNPNVDSDAPPMPFTGPGANFAAAEQFKASRSQLMALQTSLSLPLTRMFRSPEEMAMELIPFVLRMLSPDVKPVIVNTGPSGSKSFATASVRKASEKALVKQAVEAMAATGVRFEKSRIEIDDVANRSAGFVWRMEPSLDVLAAFETLGGKKDEKVRYAVRSVLEQEWRKESALRDHASRRRRGGQSEHDELESQVEEKSTEEKVAEANKRAVKRDFFGRVIKETDASRKEDKRKKESGEMQGDEGRIWVSFHEGFSNAVRKPVTIDDILRGL
ncbi:chromosome transmission fidelity protein 18 [Cucurbitaria berberidis CBS 394.84]|uniref:Chromosome transmission fidelity protein 18 n=1 Tax=Cucurbitaria berberidis CBS 394.84 TaxID=1168544 RepID=A0A9P4GSM3_9PLEO|nr:chromosome transmission fidelity protein 18 [Cucurbitaria berberidis CBS 394.84]KAF1850600.1 chromosome transmission fidelity protein 18 [Cucurbitaria berberidis CBS 394.84]